MQGVDAMADLFTDLKQHHIANLTTQPARLRLRDLVNRGDDATVALFYATKVRPLLRNMTTVFAADAVAIQHAITPLLASAANSGRAGGEGVGGGNGNGNGNGNGRGYGDSYGLGGGGVGSGDSSNGGNGEIMETLHELNDSVRMLSLRARFVYALYEAAAACGQPNASAAVSVVSAVSARSAASVAACAGNLTAANATLYEALTIVPLQVCGTFTPLSAIILSIFNLKDMLELP